MAAIKEEIEITGDDPKLQGETNSKEGGFNTNSQSMAGTRERFYSPDKDASNINSGMMMTGMSKRAESDMM